jgi:hypothetical protein
VKVVQKDVSDMLERLAVSREKDNVQDNNTKG